MRADRAVESTRSENITAEGSAPSVLKSLRAVLPPDIPLIPVGGIDETRFGGWLRAGAAGFGIGSALYRPGIKPPELRDRAHKLVAGLRRVLPMSASGAEAQPPNDR
jgi:2-keto-3-deoxy-6-phosphogluconate aldolase